MRHTLAQQASFHDDVKEKSVITTGNVSYNLITEVSSRESVDLIYLAWAEDQKRTVASKVIHFRATWYSSSSFRNRSYSFSEGTVLSGVSLLGTVNSKIYPRECHEFPEGEQRYNFTLSLTSALNVGGLFTLRPSRQWKIPGTHHTRGWVGPRAGMDGPPPGKIPRPPTLQGVTIPITPSLPTVC